MMAQRGTRAETFSIPGAVKVTEARFRVLANEFIHAWHRMERKKHSMQRTTSFPGSKTQLVAGDVFAFDFLEDFMGVHFFLISCLKIAHDAKGAGRSEGNVSP